MPNEQIEASDEAQVAYDAWIPTYHGSYLGDAFLAGWNASRDSMVREVSRRMAREQPDLHAEIMDLLSSEQNEPTR